MTYYPAICTHANWKKKDPVKKKKTLHLNAHFRQMKNTDRKEQERRDHSDDKLRTYRPY